LSSTHSRDEAHDEMASVRHCIVPGDEDGVRFRAKVARGSSEARDR